MNKRTPVIAGNWKMYKTLAEARAFAEAFPAEAKTSTDPEVILCPPFTILHALAEAFKGTAVQVGGQDVFWQDEGAYTGEVSPVMLKDAGASHVIIGHSERRQLFGETDGSVNRKVQAALQWQLVPIICVGEKLEEREAGLTDNVVIVQVQRALLNVAPELVSGVLFAYEPVWAIGTGKTCAADEANRVCGLIRETVAKMAGQEAADQVRVLYGGSVKPETIAEQMAQSDIDGALVGGASLDPQSFAKIVGFRTAAAR
jgi:triosephosphate isomerase